MKNTLFLIIGVILTLGCTQTYEVKKVGTGEMSDTVYGLEKCADSDVYLVYFTNDHGTADVQGHGGYYYSYTRTMNVQNAGSYCVESQEVIDDLRSAMQSSKKVFVSYDNYNQYLSYVHPDDYKEDIFSSGYPRKYCCDYHSIVTSVKVI